MSTRAVRRYIASWSGPRNVSTALMRSWSNRSDTFVCDEPFYAHYLLEHGLDHPGREEVMAHYDTDPERVIAWLTGEIPGGKTVFYQKQMSHHLLPDIPRDWLDRVTNVFLIREPREMITSFIRVLPNPTIQDMGLPQQLEIFERVRATTGEIPPVIDSADLLRDPRRTLSRLCDAVGLPFEESMLSWPPGPRETDGIWAPHWYSNVEKSTGFMPYEPKPDKVPERLEGLERECLECYGEMWRHRLS